SRPATGCSAPLSYDGLTKKFQPAVPEWPLARYPAGRRPAGAATMNDASTVAEETSVIARFEVRRRACLAPDGTPCGPLPARAAARFSLLRSGRVPGPACRRRRLRVQAAQRAACCRVPVRRRRHLEGRRVGGDELCRRVEAAGGVRRGQQSVGHLRAAAPA